MKNWPRLSESLPRKPDPCSCQNCGESVEDVHIWMEHDEADKPERRFVCLCDRCAGRLIDPHPRLYARVPDNAPIPGAMPLCVRCIHRSGLNCSNRLAAFNGGPGLSITCAKPTTFHIDGRDKKTCRRFGRWENLYSSPPTACTGREISP